MADLPTGTVTFLFTDIEGSTALWEQYPEAMRHALLPHDALVEQVVDEHAGQVVRPRGEGARWSPALRHCTHLTVAQPEPLVPSLHGAAGEERRRCR